MELFTVSCVFKSPAFCILHFYFSIAFSSINGSVPIFGNKEKIKIKLRCTFFLFCIFGLVKTQKHTIPPLWNEFKMHQKCGNNVSKSRVCFWCIFWGHVSFFYRCKMHWKHSKNPYAILPCFSNWTVSKQPKVVYKECLY